MSQPRRRAWRIVIVTVVLFVAAGAAATSASAAQSTSLDEPYGQRSMPSSDAASATFAWHSADAVS